MSRLPFIPFVFSIPCCFSVQDPLAEFFDPSRPETQLNFARPESSSGRRPGSAASAKRPGSSAGRSRPTTPHSGKQSAGADKLRKLKRLRSEDIPADAPDEDASQTGYDDLVLSVLKFNENVAQTLSQVRITR